MIWYVRVVLFISRDEGSWYKKSNDDDITIIKKILLLYNHIRKAILLYSKTMVHTINLLLTVSIIFFYVSSINNV